MEYYTNFEMNDYMKIGLVGAGVLTAGIVTWKLLQTSPRHRYKSVKRGPKDTVLMMQFPRGPLAPSISNFALKLETYLRMAGIPYETNLETIFGPKGKVPWIKYNDDTVTDSQFIIEYLNKKFGIDFNGHLSNADKATARAFQKLVEDSTFWVLFYERWKNQQSFMAKCLGISEWAVKWISGSLIKNTYAQGIGRHTHEEIIHIGTQDIQALSDFLGNKPYFFGDKPCETDCTIFGMMCQLRWQVPEVYGRYMVDHCQNLITYVDRMKDKFWPDWDDCITHGFTRKATK